MAFHTWSFVLLALFAHKREFHQGVQYRIEARLDESTHVLQGRAALRYTNHAPAPLDTLYFHLHLNAFRPNSAWAQRELESGQRRFQDLGADEHAFERVSAVTVNGKRARLVFPYAPDSTVMAVVLPARIRPAHAVTLTIDWTARASTVPRRQGRKGRHYDWAHWYPRIAVYDTAGWQIQTLQPQTEFFGEFASYDVTLDIAADQVIAATGVPVAGDPGWERANQKKDSEPWLRRDAYPARAATQLGLLKSTTAGRKRVRWRAEQVHHFAWAADPNYVYEGDRIGNVALHVLYLQGDTLWPGAVLNTMKGAVEFFDTLLGPYVYPQLTTSRRIDGNATEFPMITMHGVSPAVVHETGHQWLHAILANNEFRDAWLDEGLVTFLGPMYTEARGGTPDFTRTLAAIARIDSAGASLPIATSSARFHDFNSFGVTTYFKASLVFRMLRWYLGDQSFRKGLRLYYEKNKLQHVDENDLKIAMEEASAQKLGWFFEQWLHTTRTLDYEITAAQTERQSDGTWRTRVDVARSGDIWMPVDLRIGSKTIRLDSRERVFSASVDTAEKPTDAVLDPDSVLIDIARANNSRSID